MEDNSVFSDKNISVESNILLLLFLGIFKVSFVVVFCYIILVMVQFCVQKYLRTRKDCYQISVRADNFESFM